MTSIAQKRLKSAAEGGTIIISPAESQAIHHESADKPVELKFGQGLTNAAQKLIDLLRPLTPEEQTKAGIVRHH